MTSKRKYLFTISLSILVIVFLLIFRFLCASGVYFKGEKSTLLIPTGATYNQVLDSIYSGITIKSRSIFEWISRKKNYPSLIKPGRYVINENMSYLRFVNILRSGRQTPVDLTFNNIKTIWQLAGKAGGQIEADSLHIASFLSDPGNFSKDGFIRENVISVFIPNTYEFYWNTTATSFYSRMLKEYNKFWTEERISRAISENLTRIDVSVLASIVDQETTNDDEKRRIAWVYLNRLKRGMPLQSDPTIKFALSDFTITRILYRQLQIDSPYNTYKHAGLPPGPIGCATVEGIDAVLNAEKNDYLFFVAKADFSGYHNFSRTLSEHNHYAAEYQKELDKRKIFR
jgi:UPF0755 protein